VLNAVFNKAQFWDGRAEDLKAQAKGPIQAGVEMNNLPEQVVITLKSMPEYVERFERSFPGEADPVSFDYMAKAIEAFEVTLVSPNAPFDQRLEGNDAAMTDAQKGCPSCHTGVNLGGQDYFPFGLIKRPGADIPPPEDKGSRAGRRRDGHLAARSHAELRGIGPDRGVSAQPDGRATRGGVSVAPRGNRRDTQAAALTSRIGGRAAGERVLRSETKTRTAPIDRRRGDASAGLGHRASTTRCRCAGGLKPVHGRREPARQSSIWGEPRRSRQAGQDRRNSCIISDAHPPVAPVFRSCEAPNSSAGRGTGRNSVPQ
jgi:hypothetical protein